MTRPDFSARSQLFPVKAADDADTGLVVATWLDRGIRRYQVSRWEDGEPSTGRLDASAFRSWMESQGYPIPAGLEA